MNPRVGRIGNRVPLDPQALVHARRRRLSPREVRKYVNGRRALNGVADGMKICAFILLTRVGRQRMVPYRDTPLDVGPESDRSEEGGDAEWHPEAKGSLGFPAPNLWQACRGVFREQQEWRREK